MANFQQLVKQNQKAEVTFATLTPINEITIPAMNDHLEDKTFTSYEELHYHLKCLNTMCLAHAKAIISSTWVIDGMGSELILKNNIQS